jgi:hypothetical protein
MRRFSRKARPDRPAHPWPPNLEHSPNDLYSNYPSEPGKVGGSPSLPMDYGPSLSRSWPACRRNARMDRGCGMRPWAKAGCFALIIRGFRGVLQAVRLGLESPQLHHGEPGHATSNCLHIHCGIPSDPFQYPFCQIELAFCQLIRGDPCSPSSFPQRMRFLPPWEGHPRIRN